MRTPRRGALVLMGVGIVVLFTAVGIDRLRVASALTVSYTSALPAQESLLVDAYETASAIGFFQSTARRLTAGKRTDEDKLEALMDWTHENVRPQYAAPNRVVADNFYDIVRRGFGYCDQAAHVFATLAHFAGYDSRLLFLLNADGVSPHTVAQVNLKGRWVVVDPWVGVAWEDAAGRLLTVDDVARNPAIYATLPYASFFQLPIDDFERGTPFFTFPYQPAGDTLQKVIAKVTHQPVAPPPSTIGLAPLVAAQPPGIGLAPLVAAQPPGIGLAPLVAAQPPGNGAAVTTRIIDADTVLRYDQARREQLDGNFRVAASLYRDLLGRDLDTEMAQSARFFEGLSLLDAGDAASAVTVFRDALRQDAGAWTPSVLRYEGKAYAALGDIELAKESLRLAATPGALDDLAELGDR